MTLRRIDSTVNVQERQTKAAEMEMLVRMSDVTSEDRITGDKVESIEKKVRDKIRRFDRIEWRCEECVRKQMRKNEREDEPNPYGKLRLCKI